MTKITTLAKTGRIERVNPADLTVGLNVRDDTTVDKDFVNSIKQNGVLQPPMVTPNDSSGYEIVFGHRRTLGAIEAGITEFDVYVVDREEAEAARLVDQLTENQQRKNLSHAEEAGGFKKLALFGFTPAQIALQTSTNRKTVDTALAVAGNPAALEALTEHPITLDQAAEIVGFSNDKTAVKALTKQAAEDPGKFALKVAELTKDREVREHIAKLHQQILDQNLIELPDASGTWASVTGLDEGQKATRLDLLAQASAPFEPLDATKLSGFPGLAARVTKDHMMVEGGYRFWAVIQYFVINATEHGYVELQHESYTRRPLTDEEKADNDAREARQQAANERRSAFTTAKEVRHTYLAELLQRTKLPTDTTQFTAWVAVTFGYFFDWELDDTALTLLGLTPGQGSDPNANDHINVAILKNHLTGNPKHADRILLALAIYSIDGALNTTYAPTDIGEANNIVRYVTQLTKWGYSLSAVEQTILDEAVKYIADDAAAKSGLVTEETEITE